MPDRRVTVSRRLGDGYSPHPVSVRSSHRPTDCRNGVPLRAHMRSTKQRLSCLVRLSLRLYASQVFTQTITRYFTPHSISQTRTRRMQHNTHELRTHESHGNAIQESHAITASKGTGDNQKGPINEQYELYCVLDDMHT